VARNLLDPVDGFLRNATHLIHDRDPLFTLPWTKLLESGGVVKCVPVPAKSPNCKPYGRELGGIEVCRDVRRSSVDKRRSTAQRSGPEKRRADVPPRETGRSEGSGSPPFGSL